MRFATAVLSLALFAAPVNAQTTGMPGINDYTVSGMLPGSTSCNPVAVPFIVPVTFTVSTLPGFPVAILFNFCPGPIGAFTCAPGFASFPPCFAPPINSLDILYGIPPCVGIPVVGLADAAGMFSVTLPPCGIPFYFFSTQAVIVDPFSGCLQFTQAYDVVCI